MAEPGFERPKPLVRDQGQVTNMKYDQNGRAKDLIKETLKSNVKLMKKFDVEVKGLGPFGDRVVFAEVGVGADVLKELNKVFSAAFRISQSLTPPT